MADVKIRILFSTEGLAGVKSAREEVQTLDATVEAPKTVNVDPAPAVQGLQKVEKQAAATGQEVQRFSGRSGTARMAVIGFSQSMQDASMFQQSFRMGMMSIGNNVDMVVQSLTMLADESKRTGVSMSSSLLAILKGPTGILVAVSVLITLLQVLPGLFSSVSKAAKEASDQGLKDFAEWAKNASQEQQEKWKAYADRRVKEIKADIDLLERVQPQGGYAAAKVGTSGLTALTADEQKRLAVLQSEIQANPKLRDQLEEQKTKYSDISKQLDGTIERSKAQAKILKDESELLAVSGSRYQQLNLELEQLNQKHDKTRSDYDRIAQIRKELAAMSATSLELEKASLSKLKEKEDYERALLADHKGSLDKLGEILTAELRLTKNVKDRYELEKEIAAIRNRSTATLPGGAGIAGMTLGAAGTTAPTNLPNYPETLLPETIGYQENAISKLQEQLAAEVSEVKRQELREQIADHQDALNQMQMDENQYAEYTMQKWREQGNIAATVIDGINSGVRGMFDQFIIVHRRAKDAADAIWIGIENTALSSLENIISRVIQTLAVNIVLGNTSSAATIAQMSAITAAAAPAALAVNIASFGGAGLAAAATAPEAGASLAATLSGLHALLLAEGTKIDKPTLAIMGEAGTEFAMPSKTFYDVAREEIIPRVLQMAYSQSQPGSSHGNELLNEIKAMRKDIASLQLKTGFKGSDMYVYLRRVNATEGKYGI